MTPRKPRPRNDAMTESELSELDDEMVELGEWLDAEMVELGEWLDSEMPAISKFIEELRVSELAYFQNQFDNDDEADT